MDEGSGKTAGGGTEKEAEAAEEEGFAEPPVAELRRKPKDPRTAARWNFISRLLFIWIDPLMWLGWRNDIKQEDLYVHPQEVDAERLLKKFNKHWAEEVRKKECGGKARLWLALFKCIWHRLLLQGVLMFLEVALQVGQSVVLGYLANYFTIEDPTSDDTRDAYLLAGGLVAMAFVITLLHGHGFLVGQKVGMISRVMCTNAIYQKILKLSQVTLGKVSTGHVINLASNDVQRFDLAFLFIHFLWISPLHLAVFTFLVYREVGWPAFLALAFVILQIPLQVFLARLFGRLRLRSAQVTDNRVRIMNEVITGIRVIKMYAWEYAFRNVVNHLRKYEFLMVFLAGLFRMFAVFLYITGRVFIMVVIYTAVGLAGEPVTPRAFFTILSLSWPLAVNIYRHITLSVIELLEASVAVLRMKVTSHSYTRCAPTVS
jgi:ATP-binding cassette subfamily C (CFTR/MRP) protein 4